jgi:dTDP-4-amino-4,6-dideoxygalactose transaminase
MQKKYTVPFNRPPCIGSEEKFVVEAIRNNLLAGDNYFGKKCQDWFDEQIPGSKTLLTPSCTHALELAAILIDVKPGDEVIMPSYTFVSTANAFVLRGAKIVFVDVRKDTMNIDETKIEDAITDKTVAIVVVHYAGISCEMDTIMQLADKKRLYVIEDAAQGMLATYKNRPLGSIGHLGTYSFHETKNYTSGGEGGLLLINDARFNERAEIIREKGTNRSKFFRGMVDKYSWIDVGSSYLPSELQAAYLYGQLLSSEKINSDRKTSWNRYFSALKSLSDSGYIEIPNVPPDCVGNGHMFFIKTDNIEVRTQLTNCLREKEVVAVFHYVPLHSAEAGAKFGRFNGDDVNTTSESERLLRLPLYYGIEPQHIDLVISIIEDFYKASSKVKH